MDFNRIQIICLFKDSGENKMKKQLIKELKRYKLNIEKEIKIIEKLNIKIKSFVISNTTNSIYINDCIRISNHNHKEGYINIDINEKNNIEDINLIIKKSQNWTKEQWEKFNDYSYGFEDFINKIEDNIMEVFVHDIEEMLA